MGYIYPCPHYYYREKGEVIEMTVAKTKEEFVRTWREYISELAILDHSTDDMQKYLKLKSLMNELYKLTEEIAEEAFSKEKEEEIPTSVSGD